MVKVARFRVDCFRFPIGCSCVKLFMDRRRLSAITEAVSTAVVQLGCSKLHPLQEVAIRKFPLGNERCVYLAVILPAVDQLRCCRQSQAIVVVVSEAVSPKRECAAKLSCKLYHLTIPLIAFHSLRETWRLSPYVSFPPPSRNPAP